MDNLFNDQVVPVTKYDIKKFKKDYGINNCVPSENLQYDSATNRYYTTNSDVIVKISNGYFETSATNPHDLPRKIEEEDFSGCYIDGYENKDNYIVTSQSLQEKIDNRKLEVNKSYFTGYYHRITFATDIHYVKANNIDNVVVKKERVGYYPVFHTDDILELRKKPSEKFIKYFFYSLFTTILLAVITCCTEFWLIYSGDKNNRKGKDSEISIKVENSCKNIGEHKDNTYNCNILEQVFRWRIWNYPYQKCKDYIPPQGGGAKSRYDYYYNYPNEKDPNEKNPTDKGNLPNKTTVDACVVKGDITNREYDYRPFPYNIGEKADKIFNSELGTIIPRNVGYVILFIMLMYRYLVYHIFKNVSDFYNRSLKDLPIIKLIIFLASPFLISLFINIVPILSTIGVLFFILFMIVQILQVTTDVSIKLEELSSELLSKDMIVGCIFACILCYISFIIISKIVLISNTSNTNDSRDDILEHNKRSKNATIALIIVIIVIIIIFAGYNISNIASRRAQSAGNGDNIAIVVVALLIGVGISLGTLLPQKNSQSTEETGSPTQSTEETASDILAHE